MKKIISSVIALLVVVIPFFAYAQQGEPTTTEVRKPVLEDGTVVAPFINVPQDSGAGIDCFDYYRFGSVQVSLDGNKDSFSPGERLNLKGKVVNENDYPIVKGSVFVKIFRKQSDSEKNHANGFNLVDQFFVDETFNLDRKEQKDIAFFWRIPEEAISGDYQVATYFTVDKKFNMLGLSFTDDVVGNTFDFAVKNGTLPAVYFDKNNVSVNGNKYRFAAFPPRFSKDGEVTVTAELVNDSEKAQIVPVTWTLYSWDGQRAENILKRTEEQVLLEAKSKKTLTYIVSDATQPVYYLTAHSNYQDTKSLLNVRFVRQDVDKVRFNFPALTKFPLQAGEPTTLFSCLHGMGTADVVGNNKVLLSLVDSKGKTIHSYTYEGNVTGAMMGLKSDFTPKKNYTNLTLKAELYTNNILVDSSQINYDCAQLGGAVCQSEAMKAAAADGQKQRNMAYVWIILLLLLFVAGLFLWSFRKKKLIVMLAALSVCGGLFGLSSGVEAKSVQWNKQVDGMLYYHWNRTWHQAGGGTKQGDGWWLGLGDPNVSITYKATVKNEATGKIVTDGSSVPVGTVLLFETTPYEDTDISWFGTGYSADSPYGHWVNKAKTPEEDRGECNTGDEECICKEDDFVSDTCISVYFMGAPVSIDACKGNYDEDQFLLFKVYVPLNVNPPTATITHDNSTAGLNCNASGSRCTVVSVGQIQSQFVFDSTYGKFYYRYWDYREGVYGGNILEEGCYGNNTPLSPDGKEAYVLDVPAQKIDYNIQATTLPNQFEKVEVRFLDQATSLAIDDYNNAVGYVVGGENYSAALTAGESGEIEKNFIPKEGNPEVLTVNVPAQLVSHGQTYVHASTRFNCNGNITTDQGTLTDGGSCVAVVRYVKNSDEAVRIDLVGLSIAYNDSLTANPDRFTVSGPLPKTIKTVYANSSSDNAGDYVASGQTRQVTVVPPEIAGYTYQTPLDYTGCAGGVLADGGSCNVRVMYSPDTVVNAHCGSAAKSYNYNETTFQGALCSPSNSDTDPTTVSFPAQGGTSTWICKGKNGGSDSPECVATRANPTWQCNDGSCSQNDCGKVVKWTCLEGTSSRSQAECEANGKTCQDAVCPACKNNWYEVIP